MSYAPSSVLVPFDYSDRCIDAVRYATTIVQAGGSLHVANIIDDFYPEYAAIAYSDTIEAKRRVLHLQKMREQIESAGIDLSALQLHCEMGNAATELARLASNLDIALVVIPSHGRKGVQRWWLGSVAERVARLSPCPVLILKDDSVRSEIHSS